MNNNFKYETHTHTSEASACAVWSAKESVFYHKKSGYTGIIITDHFYYGNTAISRNLSWSDWVHGFCKGFNNAKVEGDKLNLQVFMGWESCYQGTEFLIYGLTEDWLLDHPEIKGASIEEQFMLIHSYGGLIIQAHPFREESYIKEIRLFPNFVDGVEVFNACHSSKLSKAHFNPTFNERALKYAKEQNLSYTAGSDSHTSPILNGGMIFDHKLKDINDFIKCVKSKSNYSLLTGADMNPVELYNL